MGHIPVAKPSPIQRGWPSPKRGLTLALVLLGAFSVGGVMLATAWPTEPRPPDVFVVRGVAPSDLEVGQPVRPEGARFWLVKTPDYEITALASRDPRNGCSLPWRLDFTFDGKAGWFRDPCHGSTYDAYGHKVFGPSSRDMDHYEVAITGGGQIYVDTSHVICSDGSIPCDTDLGRFSR